MNENKLIIFSAPSGSGKTTIVHQLMEKYPWLEFSVSATSRAPRGAEQNGKDYHFLSADEFEAAISEDKFVEWEEVYAGTKYGTLRSELERIWAKGNTILLDELNQALIKLKAENPSFDEKLYKLQILYKPYLRYFLFQKYSIDLGF